MYRTGGHACPAPSWERDFGVYVGIEAELVRTPWRLGCVVYWDSIGGLTLGKRYGTSTEVRREWQAENVCTTVREQVGSVASEA